MNYASTSTESAAFFNQVIGLALSDDDVSALERRTEGWIAGLQLAALALQAPRMQESGDIAGFIAAFTGSHHYVADYLAAEVLNRQPEPVRSFLLQTSILGRMTGELCDRLTEQSNSQATLRQLETANLFLVPLDEERHWYRYHHLFADVLRAQLDECQQARLSRRGIVRDAGFDEMTEAVQLVLDLQINPFLAGEMDLVVGVNVAIGHLD